jgi:hypothetical protein
MSMFKHLGAAVVALTVLMSSLVVVTVADAGGTEEGGFPDRVFVLTKGRGDKSSLAADITPTYNCTWWVELTTLGGTSVSVEVFKGEGVSSELLATSRLTEAGEESKYVDLVGGMTYTAKFSYLGRPGYSELQEHALAGHVMIRPHASILITSDYEFTEDNGVVSGSGTSDDPYLISGWKINSRSETCIEIRNTRAFFEVRNVSLRTNSWQTNLIVLSDVWNGAVIDATAMGGQSGLFMNYSSNVEIVRCGFNNFISDVDVVYCSDFRIRDCILRSSSLDMGPSHGLMISWSSDFVVEGCSISVFGFNLMVGDCTGGLIKGNTVAMMGIEGLGLYLMSSTYMTLYSNHMVNTSIDIVSLVDIYAAFATHVIPSNNTANGKPVLYMVGENNVTLDRGEYGELIFVDCQDVALSNLSYSRCFAAVILDHVVRASVMDSTFDLCFIAIRVSACHDVGTYNNTVTRATFQAIGIWYSDSVVIQDTNAYSIGTNNLQDLLIAYHSNYVSFCGNTIDTAETGILAFDSTNCLVQGNRASNMSSAGIRLWLVDSFMMRENVVIGNFYGAILEGSGTVYHNDFIGNAGSVQYGGGTIVWDNGYPSGGNYWSDYLYWGVDANGDGIGDTPYMIWGDGQDRYPLMQPCNG